LTQAGVWNLTQRRFVTVLLVTDLFFFLDQLALETLKGLTISTAEGTQLDTPTFGGGIFLGLTGFAIVAVIESIVIFLQFVVLAIQGFQGVVGSLFASIGVHQQLDELGNGFFS